jgi:hypothetical protein
MDLIGADLLRTEPVGRTIEVARKPRSLFDVRLLGCGREIPDPHVFDESLT